MGTFIAAVILAAAVFFAVRAIVRNRKSGKCSCGCEGCAMKDSCRSRGKQE